MPVAEATSSWVWPLPVEGWVAIATIALVLVTGLLWWATRQLVKEAERTRDIQLRAYVGFERVEARPFDIGRPTFSLVIKNFGASPAHKPTLAYAMGLTGDANRETITNLIPHAMSDLAPGQVVTHWTGTTLMITNADFGQVGSRLARLLVQGQLTYMSLGAQHTTSFKFTHPWPDEGTTPHFTINGNEMN